MFLGTQKVITYIDWSTKGFGVDIAFLQKVFGVVFHAKEQVSCEESGDILV